MSAEDDLNAELSALREQLAEARGEIEALRGAESQAVGPAPLTATDLVGAALDAVRQSEERFAKVFRLSPISISINTIADDRYLDVNDSFLRLTGYAREQVIGHAAAELNLWDDPSQRSAFLDRVRHEGIVHDAEVRFRRRNGEIGHLLLSTEHMNIDGHECYLGIGTDITRRKQAEEKLAASISLLKATLESTADGILAVDTEGATQNYNQKLLELWGMPPTAMAGAFHDRMRLAANELKDPERFIESVRNALSLPDAAFADVLEFKDGRVLERHCRTQRIAGRSVGLVWSFRDITNERRMQSMLIANDRMASMGSLAAGVAHEINNPLACVIANLGLLSEELPSIGAGLDDHRRQDLGDLVRESREGAERVARIVRDLRSFSRSDDDETGVADIERVLDFAANLARSEIRHRARLVKDFGRTPLVVGAEGRLGQVFVNLLVNAAQAIREGDVEHNEIRVVTRTLPSGDVTIEVRDSGSGIPEELREKIFLPFFTTKAVGMGTGLGLSVAHGIVTSLGGQITVESEEGKGTTFRVRLPAAPTPPVARSAQRGDPPPQLARLQILVVDDDVRVAQVLRRLLQRNHEVHIENGGRAALAYLASGAAVDLILCDLMMPEMTGMDLHDELVRAFPAHAATMAFISGGAFTTRARQFLERVPNERLEKPFDAAAVNALVQRLIARKPA